MDAVITSFNQKVMISEAVDSLKSQTLKPKRIIIVDDGSTDQESLDVLHSIENDIDLKVPVKIIYKKMLVCLQQEILELEIRKLS